MCSAAEVITLRHLHLGGMKKREILLPNNTHLLCAWHSFYIQLVLSLEN